jgi:opacity protein-like surface antigen
MKTLPVALGILVLVSCSTVSSQTLKLGIGGGASVIQSPDYFTTDISQAGLGFGTSYSIGGKAKLSLPAVPAILVGQVSYLFMSGNGTFNNRLYVPQTQGDIQTKTHMLSIGVGVEWVVLPGPVAPYLGADFLLSSVGELSYKVENSSGMNEYLSGGGTRYGIGLGAGAQFSVTPSIDLDIGGKYNLNSLFGKDTGESNFNTVGITATVLFSIM